MTELDMVDAFERNRPRLRGVAYRMLGSLAEADDAVQETWLRVSRADAGGVETMDAWLTTIVVRVCLNMLRSRNTRREEPIGVHVPDPIISHVDGVNPEDAALLADSVGLALQVVLGTLAPAERLAFVLHDMFNLPFDEIAPMVGRSPATARQLASRARRRVRGNEVPAPDPDIGRQREVVDAFFAAARRGDLDALVAALDPDVVLRADEGAARQEESVVVHGAAAVAGRDPSGTGERRRGCRADSGRPTGLGPGLHRLGREDRPHRRDGRPGPPRPARPGRPELTYCLVLALPRVVARVPPQPAATHRVRPAPMVRTKGRRRHFRLLVTPT
jgi:RNA polymerase sigma factor (sigma-70 family)